MIALCIDDEPILLEWLARVVSASPDIDRVEKFTNELDAINFADLHPFDVAFLDIELHSLDGLAVAERLRAAYPDCGIIFCTGHANYAVDAITRLQVDGYLLKPIDEADVQRELDRLKKRLGDREKLLSVDLSHGIHIFDRAGTRLRFRRSKTEELFAALVRSNGESLSSTALCELLWTDSEDPEKNKSYLAQLLSDLRRTLEECEAQDVLERHADGYALCMSLLRLHSA